MVKKSDKNTYDEASSISAEDNTKEPQTMQWRPPETLETKHLQMIFDELNRCSDRFDKKDVSHKEKKDNDSRPAQTGYIPGSLIHAMNTVVGLGHWRWVIKDCKTINIEKDRGLACLAEVDLVLQIGNWLDNQFQILHEVNYIATGVSHSIFLKGEAYKKAVQQALKWCFAAIGLGMDAYRGRIPERIAPEGYNGIEEEEDLPEPINAKITDSNTVEPKEKHLPPLAPLTTTIHQPMQSSAPVTESVEDIPMPATKTTFPPIQPTQTQLEVVEAPQPKPLGGLPPLTPAASVEPQQPKFPPLAPAASNNTPTVTETPKTETVPTPVKTGLPPLSKRSPIEQKDDDTQIPYIEQDVEGKRVRLYECQHCKEHVVTEPLYTAYINDKIKIGIDGKLACTGCIKKYHTSK